MAYGQVNADVIGTSVAGSNLGAGDASLMKNRIINGAMVIDQRNAGASSSAANTYTLDRWFAYQDVAGKYTVQQNAGSVTPPVGFTKYLGVTSLSAYTVGATGYNIIQQAVEGYNIADLGWGTANAKTVTVSFWVYSSLTGNFGGTISSSASQRAYPFLYAISAANTWEYKTITIAGDTSGTWSTDNSAGLILRFGIGVGSTYSATAGSWTSTNFIFSATGATSVVGTSGATFYITGVQLEVGSSATGFEYRLYNQELSACYRYFQKFLGSTTYEALPSYVIAGSGGNAAEGFFAYKGTMRSTPSLAISTLCLLDAANAFTMSGASVLAGGLDSMRINYTGLSGLTQYRSYYITANNSTSAYLQLSAEL